jgi:hypothetical protein
MKRISAESSNKRKTMARADRVANQVENRSTKIERVIIKNIYIDDRTNIPFKLKNSCTTINFQGSHKQHPSRNRLNSFSIRSNSLIQVTYWLDDDDI